MKQKITQTKYLRIQYVQNEHRKLVLKMYTSFFFNFNESSFVPKFCLLLKKNGYISLFKNYCILSKRGRSVFSRLRLARWAAKELASYGELSGFKKRSW